MFTRINDFVSSCIGTFTVGVEKLHVLLATYNNVKGYESGSVETHKDGLTIQVQNGNLEYSPMTALVSLIGTPLAAIGGDIMDEEARAAQRSLESQLSIKAQENTAFLAVVYAGLSAFDEAVAFARKIKHEDPAAKVVVVTCDCDPRYKANVLTPMLGEKEIDAVVITGECGGRAAMRDILEKIVSDWPAEVPA